MRHQKSRGKLERPAAHRLAMIRNQVTSLLEHEQIRTTDAKAKVLRRVADRMITLGKRGTLHARRRALAVIRDRAVTAKVFDELAARYAARSGGYTRVLKLGQRVGDAAPISVVELVDARRPAAAKPAEKEKGGKAGREAEAPKGRKAAAGKGRSAKAEGAKPAREAKPRRGKTGTAGPAKAGKGGRAARGARPRSYDA